MLCLLNLLLFLLSIPPAHLNVSVSYSECDPEVEPHLNDVFMYPSWKGKQTLWLLVNLLFILWPTNHV